MALAAIGGVLALMAGETALSLVCLVIVAAFLFVPPLRSVWLHLLTSAVNRVGRASGGSAVPALPRLVRGSTWATALLTSIAAWLLPAAGVWVFVASSGAAMTRLQTMWTFVSASLIAGVTFAPGGVVVTGGRLLDGFAAAGVPDGAAALLALGIRLATAGVSTAFGLVFLVVHLRSEGTLPTDHFDAIAEAYDVQIPEARRQALLTRKTGMMRERLERYGHWTHAASTSDADRAGMSAACASSASM